MSQRRLVDRLDQRVNGSAHQFAELRSPVLIAWLNLNHYHVRWPDAEVAANNQQVVQADHSRDCLSDPHLDLLALGETPIPPVAVDLPGLAAAPHRTEQDDAVIRWCLSKAVNSRDRPAHAEVI